MDFKGAGHDANRRTTVAIAILTYLRGEYNHTVEFLPSAHDMLFLYRIGAADCEKWMHSLTFCRIIETYGTHAEKARLHQLEMEFRASCKIKRQQWLATQDKAEGEYQ